MSSSDQSHPLRAFNADRLSRSAYVIPYLLRYNLACIICLQEASVIPPETAGGLLRTLLEIGERGDAGVPLDPALEDLQPNLELVVEEALGLQGGGGLTTGRSRAEVTHIAERLALREELIAARAALLGLGSAILSVAREHLDTVVPYYTCHQRAEPITFGYYLASFAEELQAHDARIEAAYHRLDASSAGVGHIVPTAVPLDRTALAALLGFGSTVRHSLYGYLNVDVEIDVLGTLALAMATLSRLSLDLYLWASSDIGLVDFGDDFVGRSYVMPQKRNPDWLRTVRPAAMRVASLHQEALGVFLHTAPMELGGVVDVPAMAHDALSIATRVATTTASAMQTIEVRRERAVLVAGEDFAGAGQLVGAIVATELANWREAHHVVRAIAAAARRGDDAEPLPALIERFCATSDDPLSRKLAPALRAAARDLSARAIVESRDDSGPAPDAVVRNVSALEQAVASGLASCREEEARLARVWAALEDSARGR